MQGLGANGFGQAVTLLIQLASVPILIHAWGIELYGEWITVSAIPAYLVLSDIGLSLVAGNSLALIADKGDTKAMQNIYQSTWVMVSALSLAVLGVVVTIVLYTEPARLLGLTQISGTTLKVTLLLLFAHVALSMQTGIMLLPFRAMKKTPVSVAAINMIRLLEWVVATVVVLFGGGVVDVSLTFLLMRMLGNYGMWLMLNRSGSPLHIGARCASLNTVRTMLRPSLASMCFPLGLSFTLQGFILLVGSVVGPVGVAFFSIYRTFTRIPIQLATAISRSVWPELSYAIGANELEKAKKLVIKMVQVGLVLALFSGAGIYYFGEDVIDFWVARALDHNPLLLMGLTLAALVHVLWQSFWVALMATNKHSGFAAYFVAISILSLLLCWVCLGVFGLPGAGYAALLSECLMLIAALYSYNEHFRLLAND